MKKHLKLFSWVSTELVQGLLSSTGETALYRIQEALQHYNLSAHQIAQAMQTAWQESLRTLEATLGGGSWLSPRARKELAQRFTDEILKPFFAQKRKRPSMQEWLEKALAECRILQEHPDLINFSLYQEEELLAALALIGTEGLSELHISQIITESIQEILGPSSYLMQLLSFRNLLLEGLLTHFNLEVARIPGLSNLVGLLDRQRISQQIQELKQLMQQYLEQGQLHQIGHLGRHSAALMTLEKNLAAQERYRALCGDVLGRLDVLAEEHRAMQQRLSEILSILREMRQLQCERGAHRCLFPQYYPHNPNDTERKLATRLTQLLDSGGWQQLPCQERESAAHTLALSYFCDRQTELASEVLEKAMQAGCQTALIYFNHFQAAQSAGKYTQALESYHRAIHIDPKLAIVPPNKYKLLEVIGRGGMGVVYKARHLNMGRLVAIKVLLLPEEQYPGMRERFTQAATLAASLRHQYIVLVYDSDCLRPKYPFLVMEYLEGIDLERKVKADGPFALQEGLQIALKIAQALDYAHSRGVVHRDLKPGNIFLTAQGPKIIDFGLAKSEKDKSLTAVGEGFYTPHYSAPEQRADFRLADARSDIYSLGKTLYYLFTGDTPFDLEWEELPRAIWPIVRKATRKNPQHRYQNISQMLQALNAAAKGKTDPLAEERERDSDSDLIVICASPTPTPELKNLPAGFQYINDQVICLQDQAPMALVPAGTFWMGAEDEGITSQSSFADETPIHEVWLSAYLIDIYPVTNERYRLFLNAIQKVGGHHPDWCHPCEPKTKDNHVPLFWDDPQRHQPDHPVVGIDWWDAYAYCCWCAKQLPTEAQWEKAARGADLRKYPWGEQAPCPQRCNFARNRGGTCAVTEYKDYRSPYGCYNMVGNVWEWCQDWYSPHYYENSPRENPQGPSVGQYRVGRGGSWMTPARWIHITARAYGLPGDRRVHLGFRCAKALPTSGC